MGQAGMEIGETIVALSSGVGRAGIAVIRISGPDALSMLDRMISGRPKEREARVRRLRDATGGVLDEALVVWFAAGRSFTGEDLVELHCHGGVAIIRAVLDFLSGQAECRLAEPGEFTLKAFRNGRIDLAGAEALADLIDAETEEQRKQSLRLLDGDLHRRIGAWRADLLRALALVEVTIDWADEEVPQDVSPEVQSIVDRLVDAFDRELVTSHAAARLRHGFEVAILGAPNAGKSSFINYLSGREAAITSPIPGTTRDVVELRYDLGGIPVHFLDMAGLRETADPIETEGVKRAVARARSADIRLRFASVDAPFPESFQYLLQEGDFVVVTKADQGGIAEGHQVSTKTGVGIEGLLKQLEGRLARRVSTAGLLGHTRQQEAVALGREALVLARNQLETAPDEVIAEHLRDASRALAKVLGEIGVEDVLGDVFAKFCLGK
ncbi:MAG: tRNA uridine-5-carboxymethylaminomethyl(34) synthesis GTPase MnmE [Pseudomonadota bacterium]